MRTSVLINTCNHGAFIGDCLNSVFRQTRPPDEIVVYDDGSTDGTLSLLRGRRDAFTLIAAGEKSRRTGRQNQAHAIDQAFRRSTGELVFLLDGDDLFLPDKIARYAAAAQSGDGTFPVLVQAPTIQIDGDCRRQPYQPELFRQTTDALATAYARQDADLFFPTSALAFSRTFLERVLPIEWTDGLSLWSDVRLTCAALQAGRIVSLPEPLTLWRRHAGSHSLAVDASRGRLVRLTWQRTQLFNRLAAAAGKPTLSIWRNRRFYRQLARMLFPWPGNILARRAARKNEGALRATTGTVPGPEITENRR